MFIEFRDINDYRFRDKMFTEFRHINVYRFRDKMFKEFRGKMFIEFIDIPNESKASLILFHKQWMGGHFETLIKRHYWHYHHLLFFYKLHICFVFIFLSICWCSGLNFQKIDQIFSEKFQICTDFLY